MTETLKHPIAEYGERLLPSNLDLIDEQLNGLLNVGKALLDSRSRGIIAAKKVSDDFKPAAKARRQHELIDGDREGPAKLAQALQSIVRTTQAMREKIATDSRPRGPESDTRALLQYMQRRDLLADLRELKAEGKGEEIVKLLTRTTQRGDRSVLDALQSSLKPLVAPEMIEAGERYYLQATQREALENLAIQEEIEAAAKECVRRINYQGKKMVQDAVLKKEILPRLPGQRSPSSTAHLTDSQKAALIGEVGLEGYKAIKGGEKALPPAYWPDAEKEVFITKHGGKAWEGFLAGIWTPPAE